jgi:aryl carrier-like protein
VTTTDDVLRQVRRHCHDELGWPDDGSVDDTTDLIDAGLLDSLTLLELVELLARLGLPIAVDDLVPDHFASFTAMAGMIDRALGTPATGGRHGTA